MEISAIILASGYSKRMGTDKLLLKYEGKPFIMRVIETVKKFPFAEIILVARKVEIAQIAEKLNIKTIINNEASKGQSEAVKLGTKSALKGNALMFFAGDQPLIDISIITALIQEFRDNCEKIIIPAVNGVRNNPVIFPAKFREELLSIEGDQGGRAIIKNYEKSVKYVEFHNLRIFIDIDDMEDYRELLKEKHV